MDLPEAILVSFALLVAFGLGAIIGVWTAYKRFSREAREIMRNIPKSVMSNLPKNWAGVAGLAVQAMGPELPKMLSGLLGGRGK